MLTFLGGHFRERCTERGIHSTNPLNSSEKVEQHRFETVLLDFLCVAGSCRPRVIGRRPPLFVEEEVEFEVVGAVTDRAGP